MMQNLHVLKRIGTLVAVASALLIGVSGCAPEVVTAAQVEKASKDLPEVYNSDCYATYESSEITPCAFGDPDSDFEVYFVGDSHSAQWAPALAQVAEDYDWQLSYMGKRSCSFSINEQTDNRGNEYPSCEEWNEKLLDRILAEDPDLVITANYSRNYVMRGDEILDRGPRTSGEAELAEGMYRAWSQVVENGTNLVVVKDTPYFGHNVPDCLNENLDDTSRCSVSYKKAVSALPTPELMATERIPEAEVIDLNEQICGGTKRCRAVRDGLVVWRDAHHLTAMFSKHLVPQLESALDQVPALANHI